MHCVEAVDVADRLGQLRLPTLLLHGTEDRVMPLAGAEELARRIPGAVPQKMEGVGHVPTVTRPREVAVAIDRFFHS